MLSIHRCATDILAYQDVGNLQYHVILTNIETLIKHNWGFVNLWKNYIFTSRLVALTFDEGHCISKWSGFCIDYKQVERLHYLLQSNVRFYVVSATLPTLVLHDMMDTLRIRHNNLYQMHRSNDWPNIDLTVCQMVHPVNAFLDLAFLIPDN
jgi:superfamily II DNA helicase RecQ